VKSLLSDRAVKQNFSLETSAS